MTALYVALTIWGGGWLAFTTRMTKEEIINAPKDEKRWTANLILATTLSLAVGVCGLIARWLE